MVNSQSAIPHFPQNAITILKTTHFRNPFVKKPQHVVLGLSRGLADSIKYEIHPTRAVFRLRKLRILAIHQLIILTELDRFRPWISPISGYPNIIRGGSPVKQPRRISRLLLVPLNHRRIRVGKLPITCQSNIPPTDRARQPAPVLARRGDPESPYGPRRYRSKDRLSPRMKHVRDPLV